MQNSKAFTLIEILAAIIILGVILMIAIPSVTSVSNKAKQRQIKKDSAMFKSLVEAKIASDTSIELPDGKSAYFTLKSIDANSLSGDYDERSYVEVKNCNYDLATDKYSCATMKSVLYTADGKTKAEDGRIKSEKVTLVSYLCRNSDNYWCYNTPNLSPEKEISETVEPVPETTEKVKVTFRLEDGTDYAIKEAIKGGKLTSKPTNPTKSGFEFKGWKKNGTIINLNTEYFAADTVLVASWEEVIVVASSCNKYDLIKFKNLDAGYEEFYVMNSDASNDKLVLLSKNGLMGSAGNVRQAESLGSTTFAAGTFVLKLNSTEHDNYINNYKEYLTRMGLNVLSVNSFTVDTLSYYCNGVSAVCTTKSFYCYPEATSILDFGNNVWGEYNPCSSSGYAAYMTYYKSTNEARIFVSSSSTATYAVRPVVTLKQSTVCK